METEYFPGVKRPRRDVDQPLPSRAEVKVRVELYIYSSSGPSWPVLGWTLPLPTLLLLLLLILLRILAPGSLSATSGSSYLFVIATFSVTLNTIILMYYYKNCSEGSTRRDFTLMFTVVQNFSLLISKLSAFVCRIEISDILIRIILILSLTIVLLDAFQALTPTLRVVVNLKNGLFD